MFGGEQHDEFGLERVGVLELVDQQRLVAAAELVAGGLVAADQVPRAEEEIVEGEAFALCAALGVFVDELLEAAEQVGEGVALEVVGECLAPVGGGVPKCARRVGPLALVRRPRCEAGHAVREADCVVIADVGDPFEAGGECGYGVVLLGAAFAPVSLGDFAGVGAPFREGGARVGGFGSGDRDVEVAGAFAGEGGLAEVLEIDAPVEREHLAEGAAGARIVLPPEPLVPGFVEVEAGGEFGEDFVVGVDARVEGAFADQAGAEGVDGFDVRGVDLLQGEAHAVAPVVGCRLPELLVERAADAGAEFAGRFFREGDGDDLAELGAPGGDDADDAVDHHAGLAGARAGLEEDGGVDRLDGAFPGGSVCGGAFGRHFGGSRSCICWKAELVSGSVFAFLM